MKNLENTAPEVYAEFMDGNFVVKRSKRRFNQVPADQVTEWINKTCKMQNGIIGITRNDQARDRFCVTWSERSQISEDTRHLLVWRTMKKKNLHSLDLSALHPDESEMLMM